jgi:hypothetical protein
VSVRKRIIDHRMSRIGECLIPSVSEKENYLIPSVSEKENYRPQDVADRGVLDT